MKVTPKAAWKSVDWRAAGQLCSDQTGGDQSSTKNTRRRQERH